MPKLVILLVVLYLSTTVYSVTNTELSSTTNQLFLPNDEIVSQVEWSPDGSLLAVVSWIEIKIFDTSTWEQISSITEHYAYDIDWHPNAEILAGVRGGRTQEILIWDAHTGILLNQYQHGVDLSGIIILRTIDWHPNMEFLVTDTVSSANSVLIWHIFNQLDDITSEHVTMSGELVHTSFELEWSSTGNLILSSGVDDRTIEYYHVPTTRIFDFSSGQTIVSISGNGAIWGYDETLIANVYSYHINIWNIEQEDILLTFSEHQNPIISMDWNFRSNLIASIDNDNNLFIWSVETGNIYHNESLYVKRLTDVSWQPNTDILAMATSTGVYIHSYESLNN